MKIMGTTDKGFLVEMTDDELCNLMGIQPNYKALEDETVKKKAKESNPTKDLRNRIDWVGLVIPVSKLYASARSVSEAWNERYDFKKAIEFLSTVKGTLEMLGSTYSPLKTEE